MSFARSSFLMGFSGKEDRGFGGPAFDCGLPDICLKCLDDGWSMFFGFEKSSYEFRWSLSWKTGAFSGVQVNAGCLVAC